MDIFKSISAEFKARYTEDNNNQIIHNCFGHTYNLDNILSYKQSNIFLSLNEIYSASQQNFLFLSSLFDIQLTINGLNVFAVREFILVQKEYIFNFEIKPIKMTDNCINSIQVLHGQLKLEDNHKEEYYGKYNSTS